MQVHSSSGQCIIATFLVQFEEYGKVFFSVQNMCARVASVEVAFLIIGPHNIDRQRAIASKWHLLC